MTTTAQYGVALYGDSYYGLLVLNCANGSYSITGGDVSFVYNQVIQGEAGSYALTGNDATLDYDQLLNCEAGSFTLTGNDCTFIYDQTIYAGAFSFIWSGQEASLRQTHILNAEAGSYTLAGQEASLLHSHVVNSLAGQYNYIGQAATLQYNSTPVVFVESKGGVGKKKKSKLTEEKERREQLEAIVKREFDILDGTYQPEAIIEARKAISAPLQQIDFTSYDLALAQVNALLLQAKIQAAEYEAELDDEEALLMLL
jgi:hypothetical protein